MKQFKYIFREVHALAQSGETVPLSLLWPLICYPPKWPVRLQQQQLLDLAKPFSLQVFDPNFAKRELTFNGYQWGSGPVKVLLVHGWGSKAADYADVITELIKIDNLQVIAIDAPGNGSSEGDLSNLLLFVKAAEATVAEFGTPQVLIGHSLGAMANAMLLSQSGISPDLLISLAPLIKLKENFAASMAAASVTPANMELFFEDFKRIFEVDADSFNWEALYHVNPGQKHFIAYDNEDKIAPYAYLSEILKQHPPINALHFEGVGHERILKDAVVIDEIVGLVKGF